MARLGPAAAPTLALAGLAAVLAPDEAPALVATVAATLLLLTSAHLLVGLAGLPFLALGAVAVLGTEITARVVDGAGPWAGLVLAAIGGALLLALASRPLAASSRTVVAGVTLALAALSAFLPPHSPMVTPLALPMAGAGLAAAVAGLMLGDRLSRSTLGIAAASLQTGPGPVALPGAPAGRLLLLPIAAAGMAAAAAGAILLLGGSPGIPALPQAAPAISIAATAAACCGARREGLPTTLLAGLPLLVVPTLALALWPNLPDIRLPLAAAAFAALMVNAVRHDAV